MPGTFVFKPIEANLTHNTEWLGKMDPYCAFIVGDQRLNSGVCKKGGKHPHWNDTITIPGSSQSRLTLEVKDNDALTKDDEIGSCMVDLQEIEMQGKVSKWYPLYHKNKQAGEILLQASFEGAPSFQQGMTTGLASSEQYATRQQGVATGLASSEQYATRQQGVATGLTSEQLAGRQGLGYQTGSIEKSAYSSTHGLHEESRRTFVEQRQVVEPHTFMKEVDVVETRPVLKEIEVLEPHKVLKNVQYTEAVPVKKQFETFEPHVVSKDVEVIEPRLVTKEIQVIENVPVMKHVEVIESVPVMKEIETFEPQTFTKQVEVTEQVPVRRQVTVTEPVHLKKSVEFVEPIITTKTITKELKPAVIVDEKITQEVGPASVIAYSTTESKESSLLHQSVGDVRVSEEQRYSKNILSPQQAGYGYSHTSENVNLESQKVPGYSSTYQSRGLGGEPLASKYSTKTGLEEQYSTPYSNLYNKEKELQKNPKY